MDVERDMELRLSVQRALLTHVTPPLRAVSADIDPGRRLIRLRFIFEATPSDSMREAASCAATEVIADYVDGWAFEDEYPVIPPPARMEHLRLLMYHRCEDEWVRPDA